MISPLTLLAIRAAAIPRPTRSNAPPLALPPPEDEDQPDGPDYHPEEGRWLGDRIHVHRDRFLWLCDYYVNGVNSPPERTICRDGGTAIRLAYRLFDSDRLANERELRQRSQVEKEILLAQQRRPWWGRLFHMKEARYRQFGILEHPHLY